MSLEKILISVSSKFGRVTPGYFASIDDVLDDPLTEEDRAFLEARLPQLREQPFYDPECYQKQ